MLAAAPAAVVGARARHGRPHVRRGVPAGRPPQTAGRPASPQLRRRRPPYDGCVSAVVATHVAPGVVVVLRRGARGAGAHRGGGGLATGAPMTSDRRFHAASLTKPVVAAVVHAARAAWRLFLDDTVEEWLPGLLPAGDRITVADLLSHTSGIAEYNRVPGGVAGAEAAPGRPARAGGRRRPRAAHVRAGTRAVLLQHQLRGARDAPRAGHRAPPRDRPAAGGARSAGDAQRVAAAGPGRRGAGRARLRLRRGHHRLGPHLGLGGRRAGQRRPGRRPVLPRAVRRAAPRPPARRADGPAARRLAGAVVRLRPRSGPAAHRCGPVVGHTGDVPGYVSAAYTRRATGTSVRADGDHRPGPPGRACCTTCWRPRCAGSDGPGGGGSDSRSTATEQ